VSTIVLMFASRVVRSATMTRPPGSASRRRRLSYFSVGFSNAPSDPSYALVAVRPAPRRRRSNTQDAADAAVPVPNAHARIGAAEIGSDTASGSMVMAPAPPKGTQILKQPGSDCPPLPSPSPAPGLPKQ